jgi:hypothetical protein
MAANTIGFIREIVAKLRTDIPVLENRVGYAAEFMALRENYDEYKLPYMFVVPTGSTTVGIHGGDTSKQKVRYNFATFICVDNSKRERNTKELLPHEQVEFIMSKCFFSMIGYNPASIIQSDTIIFSGNFLDEMQHNKLWWQANWYVEHVLDISDPSLCPDDDYVITEVYSRGQVNGLEEIAAVEPDYNTRIDGLFEGGDGVVDNDEAINPIERDTSWD